MYSVLWQIYIIVNAFWFRHNIYIERIFKSFVYLGYPPNGHRYEGGGVVVPSENIFNL